MIITFDITEESHRLLLGLAYDRIHKFFTTYDARNTAAPETQQRITHDLLRRLTDTADASLKLLLMMHEGYIIGHCLFTVEQPEGEEPYLFIHQLEYDSGHANQDDITEGMELLTKLATAQNITKLMMITHRNPKAYAKYGFTPFRTIMIHRLTDVSSEPTAMLAALNGYSPEQLEALAQQLRGLQEENLLSEGEC